MDLEPVIRAVLNAHGRGRTLLSLSHAPHLKQGHTALVAGK